MVKLSRSASGNELLELLPQNWKMVMEELSIFSADKMIDVATKAQSFVPKMLLRFGLSTVITKLGVVHQTHFWNLTNYLFSESAMTLLKRTTTTPFL